MMPIGVPPLDIHEEGTFTFVVYRKLAADNAEVLAEAFLHSWDGA